MLISTGARFFIETTEPPYRQLVYLEGLTYSHEKDELVIAVRQQQDDPTLTYIYASTFVRCRPIPLEGFDEIIEELMNP